MAKKHNETVVEETKTTIGPDENGRYYYKAKSGKGFMNLKSPLNDDNYEEITKEEFDSLTYVAPHEPTAKEIAAKEKAQRIAALKHELAETDYVVIKIAESDDADEIAALRQEYAQVIAHRREVRSELNDLLED